MGIIIQRNVRRKIKHYNYPIKTRSPEVRLSDLTGRG